MRRVFLLVFVLLSVLPGRADAVTVEDIIGLTRAGLSDEVLLALIEVDGGVFPIDTAMLTRLKDAGVSQKVIVAMIRSGRMHPVEPAAPPAIAEVHPPPPQVVVVEQPQPFVQEVVVPVAVPVFVPVDTRRTRRSHVVQEFVTPSLGIGAPPAINSFRTIDSPHRPARKAEPTYWGWGGKLRPDAWQPRGSDKRSDSKTPSGRKRD